MFDSFTSENEAGASGLAETILTELSKFVPNSDLELSTKLP